MKSFHFAGLAGLLLGAAAVTADVITDWNSVLTDTIRATGGPPSPITRKYALLHAAMYDAVNSFDRSHLPFKFSLEAPAGGSPEAAAAGAAHAVLSTLFPERSSTFAEQFTASLSSIPDSPARAASVALGQSIATSLLAAHENDGSAAMNPYIPGAGPGHWKPTPPANIANPFDPDWGSVTPWSMPEKWTSKFRPPPPPPLDSAKYAEAFNEVKLYGAANSTARTPEQTLIAWFWANDRDGSQKPPGHLNDITQVISRNQSLAMVENARLFALLNIALADAAIIAWDAKYHADMDFWRPITGIREADHDNNPATESDPNWIPLSDMDTPAGPGLGIHGTPPFPAYISGHATFAATHAAVLREYFGRDDLTFTITSDDTPGVFRTYNSLEAIARENGLSRLFLGVHWRFDYEEAYNSGNALGTFVAHNMLQVPEPTTLLGLGVLMLMLRRRSGV